MAIVVCPKCGSKNRVDEASADRLQPVCGKCGEKLPAASAGASSAAGNGHPITVTDATFERDVLGAGSTLVLLDCWAPWCGPCRMVAPVLDQLATEANGRYIIAKLNTDENRRVATQFRIDAIPTMLLFKNGQLVDRMVGVSPKQTIERKLQAHA